MTLDELINSFEGDAVQHLTDSVLVAIAGAASWFITPWGAAVLKWLIAPFVKFVIATAVKKLDLGAYYLYKSAKNPADAEKYEDAVRATKAANESGNKDAIRKARDEQRRKFAIAVGLSS